MALQTADQTLANFDRAHAALLKQSDLQFHLSPIKPPTPPAWLTWLLHHMGPVAKVLGPAAPYIFWPALALGTGTILYLIGRNLYGLKRGGVNAGLRLTGAEAAWRPAPDQARALLEDADRLAAQGLFVEAAHLILLRSVEDIQSRRPRVLRPSLTSRDIAMLEGLPPQARDIFAGIAEAVERSLFGGQPLDGEGFGRCRQAYEAFADAGSWA